MASLYDTLLTITASLEFVSEAIVPLPPSISEPVVMVPYSKTLLFFNVLPLPEKLKDLSAISFEIV